MASSVAKIINSAGSIAAAGVINIACSLITVPLLLEAVGRQSYGLWILLATITGYFGLSNFGITASLKNKVAYLFAEKNYRGINNIVSGCTIFYLILFTLIIGVIYALLNTGLFPLEFLLSQDTLLVDRASVIFGIVITFYLFNLFVAGIVSNLFHGLQEITRLNLFTAIYSVVSSLVFIGFLWTKPSLIGIAVFQGTANVIRIIILYGILKRKFGWVRVSLRLSNLIYMKAIKMSSLYFFIGSILTLIIVTTDNLVIAHYFGLSHVFLYGVLFRLFQQASALLPVAIASWPQISTMYQNGDRAGMRNFYARVLRLNVLTKIPLFFLLAVFSSEIISLWVGWANFYSYWLVGLFLATFSLWVWNGSNSVFINAMSLHKLVQIPLLCEAVINLAISILLVKYTTLGLLGVALGTLIAQMMVAAYFIPRIVAKHLEVKPFRELIGVIAPLFLPAAVLLGLKLLIDYAVDPGIARYAFYVISVGVYALILWKKALRDDEKEFIRHRVVEVWRRFL